MKPNILFFSILSLTCTQVWPGVMAWQDLPIQDERLTPYNLPTKVFSGSPNLSTVRNNNHYNSSTKIVPTNAFIGFWTVTTLNEVAKITRLTAQLKTILLINKPYANQHVTAEQISRIKQFYPQLNILPVATRMDIEAAIEQIERENALRYIEEHSL